MSVGIPALAALWQASPSYSSKTHGGHHNTSRFTFMVVAVKAAVTTTTTKTYCVKCDHNPSGHFFGDIHFWNKCFIEFYQNNYRTVFMESIGNELLSWSWMTIIIPKSCNWFYYPIDECWLQIRMITLHYFLKTKCLMSVGIPA